MSVCARACICTHACVHTHAHTGIDVYVCTRVDDRQAHVYTHVLAFWEPLEVCFQLWGTVCSLVALLDPEHPALELMTETSLVEVVRCASPLP